MIIFKGVGEMSSYIQRHCRVAEWISLSVKAFANSVPMAMGSKERSMMKVISHVPIFDKRKETMIIMHFDFNQMKL